MSTVKKLTIGQLTADRNLDGENGCVSDTDRRGSRYDYPVEIHR